jgi:hypothetical protein
VVGLIRDYENKIRGRQEEVQDKEADRTTLKSLWRQVTFSVKSKEDMEREIDGWKTELADYRKLLEYLIQYLPLVAIPRYKNDRSTLYVRFLTHFASNQTSLSDRLLTTWR